jgi:hypothetical protein
VIYIHDVLQICHGELNCDNVFINEDGEVQIGILSYAPSLQGEKLTQILLGNIGNSMIRQQKGYDPSHDLQAIYDIASSLIGIEAISDKSSMSFLLLNDFTNLSSNVHLQELLKVRIIL